ncbi:MAG: 3-hydroxyacyl-CoA dehydrogenase [Gammaproteobacteria bacterium]
MQIGSIVAVVTGGASGLGMATVEGLVAAGAKAAIFDLNEASGRQMESRLGSAAMFSRVDVADEASVQAGLDAVVARFGAIHVLVNCAGIGHAIKTLGKDGPYPLDKFKQTITVNLIGTFNVLRLAAAIMAKNDPLNESGERGLIVNTASIAAFEGQMGQAAYSASKGGVVGMTLPIARDLASLGIRVNTIAPGIIETPMFASLSEKAIAALTENVQFPKRLGRPAEYAQLVRSLIENSYINGETIRLDGALRMAAR